MAYNKTEHYDPSENILASMSGQISAGNSCNCEGGSSDYVLPEATPTTLGGVTLVTDEDFREYMGLEEG